MAETVEPYAATPKPSRPWCWNDPASSPPQPPPPPTRRAASRQTGAPGFSCRASRPSASARLGHRCIPRGASAQLTVVCVRPDASGAIRLAPRSMSGDPDIDRSFDPDLSAQESGAARVASAAAGAGTARAPRAIPRRAATPTARDRRATAGGGQSGCASGSPPTRARARRCWRSRRSGSRAPVRSPRVESELPYARVLVRERSARSSSARRRRSERESICWTLESVSPVSSAISGLREVTPKRSASTSRSRWPSSSSPAARSGEMP